MLKKTHLLQSTTHVTMCGKPYPFLCHLDTHRWQLSKQSGYIRIANRIETTTCKTCRKIYKATGHYLTNREGYWEERDFPRVYLLPNHPDRLALIHDRIADLWFWKKDIWRTHPNGYEFGEESFMYDTKEDAEKALATNSIEWDWGRQSPDKTSTPEIKEKLLAHYAPKCK